MLGGKLFPRLRPAGAEYAFLNQEDGRPGDGLVIKAWFPLSGGEALQGGGKFLQRVERGISGKIGKDNADVIGMVKRSAGSAAVLELLDDLVVGHCRFTLAPRAACRTLRPRWQRRRSTARQHQASRARDGAQRHQPDRQAGASRR